MSSGVQINFIWFGHQSMLSSTCLRKRFVSDLHPCLQRGPWSVSLVIWDQKSDNLLTHIKIFLSEEFGDAKSMLLLHYFPFLITHPNYFLNTHWTLVTDISYFEQKNRQEDFQQKFQSIHLLRDIWSRQNSNMVMSPVIGLDIA